MRTPRFFVLDSDIVKMELQAEAAKNHEVIQRVIKVNLFNVTEHPLSIKIIHNCFYISKFNYVRNNNLECFPHHCI